MDPKHVVADSIAVATEITEKHSVSPGFAAIQRHGTVLVHAESGLRDDVHDTAESVAVFRRKTTCHHVGGFDHVGAKTGREYSVRVLPERHFVDERIDGNLLTSDVQTKSSWPRIMPGAAVTIASGRTARWASGRLSILFRRQDGRTRGMSARKLRRFGCDSDADRDAGHRERNRHGSKFTRFQNKADVAICKTVCRTREGILSGAEHLKT